MWGFGGIRGKELGASGPLGAAAESPSGALLRNVSARGNFPSPASVNMTNFHRGQKASLRQSILERSLTQPAGLVVLFPKALEINTPGGAPAWAAREEPRNSARCQLKRPFSLNYELRGGLHDSAPLAC